jgi:hypothetical protein
LVVLRVSLHSLSVHSRAMLAGFDERVRSAGEKLVLHGLLPGVVVGVAQHDNALAFSVLFISHLFSGVEVRFESQDAFAIRAINCVPDPHLLVLHVRLRQRHYLQAHAISARWCICRCER